MGEQEQDEILPLHGTPIGRFRLSHPPLTLREYLAGLAMQGLLGFSNGDRSAGSVAESAVKFADRLIAELSRTSEGK